MMNRKQLQTEIATQENAIASVKAQATSGELSRARRDELEREILKRVHLRYTVLHNSR